MLQTHMTCSAIQNAFIFHKSTKQRISISHFLSCYINCPLQREYIHPERQQRSGRIVMDRNNLSQNSSSNFYSPVPSSNSSIAKSSVSSVDRVFNYLEGHQQESNLLGKRLHEQQQQQKRYISQISTYETRIKRYEKTISKKDEEQQTLKGKLHSKEHRIQSLEFEKKKLSEANTKLEMNIELMNQKVKATNNKWFEVGVNISKKGKSFVLMLPFTYFFS